MEVLGIDIGGSGIKGAIVNTVTGELKQERYRIPTPEGAKPEAVALVVESIRKHHNWNGPIGIGFPAAIQHGIVRTASNIDKNWIGIDAAKLFSGITGCQVRVVNDADAAGVAEMAFGAGKNIERGVVLLVTVGTGLGTALFTNRVLVPNTELGHVIVKGKVGEKLASDAARKREDLDWDEWAKRFEAYLERVSSLTWPDLIIIGGGASKKFDKFGKFIKLNTPFVPSAMKNDAGIVGAAMHAFEKFGH